MEKDINQQELFPAIPTQPRQRKEDPIWEALSQLFGEPTTQGSRGLRNKVYWSLRGADASYGQIMERAMSWPFHFPGATLTETALEKHWDRLARPPLRASESHVKALQRQAELDELRRGL